MRLVWGVFRNYLLLIGVRFRKYWERSCSTLLFSLLPFTISLEDSCLDCINCLLVCTVLCSTAMWFRVQEIGWTLSFLVANMAAIAGWEERLSAGRFRAWAAWASQPFISSLGFPLYTCSGWRPPTFPSTSPLHSFPPHPPTLFCRVSLEANRALSRTPRLEPPI